MAFLPTCSTIVLSLAFLSVVYVNSTITSLSDLDSEYADIADGYYDLQALVPVQTIGTAMAVTVDFDLVSIVDFDDDSGFVTISGYLTAIWTEGRYTPVADDIDISISASAIWTPPLLVVNSMSSATSVGSNNDIAKFSLNTAEVEWKPWVYAKIACDSNSFFPFDQQECAIKISSLNLDNSEMTLTVADDTMGTSSLVENSLWKLKSTSVTSYTVRSHPYAEYKFTIQRKSQYLTFIIVCPVVIFSLVHLFVFLIPSDQTGEKSNYSITSMIGVLVTLLWAMTYIPSNATPVSIIVYYLFSEFLINVAVMIVALRAAGSDCNCCTKSSCFGNLVPGRNPEKVSNKDDTGISSDSRHDAATARDVHVSSVMTAWDDEVFDEEPETPDTLSKESDNEGNSVRTRPSNLFFLLFLCLHFCFTVAFFVPLGLNVD